MNGPPNKESRDRTARTGKTIALGDLVALILSRIKSDTERRSV